MELLYALLLLLAYSLVALAGCALICGLTILPFWAVGEIRYKVLEWWDQRVN